MDRKRQQCTYIPPVRLVLAFVLFMLSGFACHVLADDIKHHVVIITSSNSEYQHETASRIRKKLEANDIWSIVISADDIPSSPKHGRTLYVVIGEDAIKRLHEYDSDAFALRITSRKIPGLKYTSAQSDFLTAQPACRHIQLIKSLNPNWTSVGVLSSIGSLDSAAELTKCSIRYNLNLQIYAITDDSDLLITLEAAVEDNKVLLAIADPLIYNKHSVKNILLTAYRHRKPVIGYSDSFVQAGAVAAIYTSPESVGDKTAEILTGFFNNEWQFSQNIYTTNEFSISINTQVATSLELSLRDEEPIRGHIERLDRKQ